MFNKFDGFEREKPTFEAEFDRQYAHLMEQYTDTLRSIVDDHSQTADQIVQAHTQKLESWVQDAPDKKPESQFKKLLDIPVSQLAKSISETARDVTPLFEANFKDFKKILSSTDKQLFEEAQRQAAIQGVGSYDTQQTLSAASSPSARAAMEAALDKTVWKEAQRQAAIQGVGSYDTQQTLSAASSPSARAAMEAALDKTVWKEAQRQAAIQGVGSYDTQQTLSAASSPSARAAMEAALDKTVWKEAQRQAAIQGVGSYDTQQTLSAASSPSARAAMEGLLGEPETKQKSFHDDFNADEFFKSEEFFKRFYKSHGDSRGQHQTPPHSHETPRKQPDNELEQIIRAAVRNGRGERWLLTEDRTVIRRVVNTVKAAREKAQADGKIVTDRELYIRYRKLVDQPENEAGKDDLLRSFQILQALMGGSPNGKLPF